MKLKQLTYTDVENKEVKKASYQKSVQLMNKELANEHTRSELEEFVMECGYSRVKGLEDKGIFVNECGEVVKVGNRRTKLYVAVAKTYCQKHDRTLRVNVVLDGKKTSRNVAKMVYETFVGELKSDIVYMDGDMNNCHLDNIITTDELYSMVKEKDLTSEILAKRSK